MTRRVRCSEGGNVDTTEADRSDPSRAADSQLALELVAVPPLFAQS